MGWIAHIGASIGIARKGYAARVTDMRFQQQNAEFDHAAVELEKLRGDICDSLDWRARLVLPLVALAVILIFIALYGWSAPFLELPRLLVLSAFSILVAWLLLQYRPARIYRRTMRAVMGRSVAIALRGFTHTPDPVISKDKIRHWPLFPHVSSVQGTDLFKGARAEQDVTVCRLNINYHYKAQQRRESHRKSNLHAICIKLDINPLGDASAVLLPDMVDIRLHKAIKGKHGLSAAAPMKGLEQQFLAFADSEDTLEILQQKLPRILSFKLAQRDRVILAFQEGQTIALFPLESDIFVPFAPLPYWKSIDPTELMSVMSDDLAQLEDRLDVILSLQEAQ